MRHSRLDTCVSCGDYVPEGGHVCNECLRSPSQVIPRKDREGNKSINPFSVSSTGNKELEALDKN